MARSVRAQRIVLSNGRRLPNLLLEYGIRPRSATLDRLETLIESNVDHPARELMWGSPGTMLAALFLHDRTGEARWSELFRGTAR